MGSDDPTDGFGAVQGMQVNYSVDDAADAQKVFAGLAEGGEITLPIGETAWSPMFGMCIDRFGTPWMVGVDSPT
jgi:PhnB protein